MSAEIHGYYAMTMAAEPSWSTTIGQVRIYLCRLYISRIGQRCVNSSHMKSVVLQMMNIYASAFPTIKIH